MSDPCSALSAPREHYYQQIGLCSSGLSEGRSGWDGMSGDTGAFITISMALGIIGQTCASISIAVDKETG